MSARYVTHKGFSLVEMIVYLAVLVVASLVVVSTFLSLRTVFEHNRAEREIAVSVGNVLDRFAREVRAADSIDTAVSIFNATSSRLTLIQGATTTTFSIATGTVFMIQNGVNQEQLTSSRLKVESLAFSSYSNTLSEGVRVSITLSSTSTAASTTQTFTTSAVLRGSYE